MFRRISWYVTLVVVAVSLAACGSPSPKTITVTEKDNKSTVDLNKGDTLKATLVGNPTTGYQWQRVPGDNKVIRQVGEPKFKSDSSAIGSPGKVTLQFKAVKPGKVTLQLIYNRSFEPKEPPAKTFNIKVVVK